MPNWSEVLKEIQKEIQKAEALSAANKFDLIRTRYLKRLSEKTGRNVICYYSGWLQKPNVDAGINEEDKNAFMTVINGLDRSKGLDLVLHTPGGMLVAAESLGEYILKMFDNDVRAVVPQLAMSAGTMIACSCKEILMGKQSSLGPIDPQFGSTPAQGIIEEFETACREIAKNPSCVDLWRVIIGKYPPTFIGECKNAIILSKEICLKWLKENMFKEDASSEKADEIVKKLSDHSYSKTHGRHFGIDSCIEMGLKIVPLEQDNVLQDLFLTVHHAYMHTLANTPTVKIIENQKGERMNILLNQK